MDDQIFWPEGSDAPVAPGWSAVLTPLGATVHVRTNSPAWDMCTDWELLHRGRGRLAPTDPTQWFSAEELAQVPQGLVAELFAFAHRQGDVLKVLTSCQSARAHLLNLPKHVHHTEPDDWICIKACVDLALSLEANEAARLAASDTSAQNGNRNT